MSAIRTRIEVPTSFTRDQRLLFADLAIETIIDRTSRGIDINGSPFRPYSDSYTKSLDFDIAGKTSQGTFY